MDTNFVEETRRLSFKTCYFGTIALLQDVHINMPFQSWEIRPKGLNNCLMTLIAAIVELEIEIKDTQCCLRAPLDRPEVSHLLGKWMGLKKFQDALRNTGINIFPNEDSHKYVTVQEKNGLAETRLYQQMGLTASTMAYSWSKWNGEREKEKIIIQAAPQLADEPLTEDDWSLFMITRKRTMKLRMSEFDDDFSEDFAEGSEFHADMYHMALQIAPEDGQNRIKQSSIGFTHTVTELLRSTRFLIYS